MVIVNGPDLENIGRKIYHPGTLDPVLERQKNVIDPIEETIQEKGAPREGIPRERTPKEDPTGERKASVVATAGGGNYHARR